MSEPLRRIGAWAADTEAYRLGARDRPTTLAQDRVLTWPNLITATRLAALPVALHLVSDERLAVALALLWTTAVMDVADGYVARRFDQITRLGSVLDPVVDRIVTVATAISLAAAGYLPVVLAAAAIGRDIVVSVAGLRGERIGARLRVTRVGKLGSLFMLFGIPGHLLVGMDGTAADWASRLMTALVIIGLPLTYWSMAQYMGQLRAKKRADMVDDG